MPASQPAMHVAGRGDGVDGWLEGEAGEGERGELIVDGFVGNGIGFGFAMGVRVDIVLDFGVGCPNWWVHRNAVFSTKIKFTTVLLRTRAG